MQSANRPNSCHVRTTTFLRMWLPVFGGKYQPLSARVAVQSTPVRLPTSRLANRTDYFLPRRRGFSTRRDEVERIYSNAEDQASGKLHATPSAFAQGDDRIPDRSRRHDSGCKRAGPHGPKIRSEESAPTFGHDRSTRPASRHVHRSPRPEASHPPIRTPLHGPGERTSGHQFPVDSSDM
jgi:hypothetical protein